MSDLRIIPLSDSDLPAVMALEAYTGIYGWPEHSYKMAFRGSWTVVGLQLHGVLVAVLVYQLAGDQCSLLNLVVGQNHTGKGYGRKLVEYLIAEATAAGCDSVFLEVREDNVAAIRLYDSLDFSVINTRPGYYEYRGLSVTGLDMALTLGFGGFFTES